MYIRTFFISVVLVMLLVSLALSQVYSARESFEYLMTDTLGANPVTPANGWLNNWTLDVGHTWGSGCSEVIGAYPLVYGDLLYPVTNIGNHLTVYTAGSWAGAIAYKRTLDQTWPNTAGSVYWTSHIFDVEPAPAATDNYFLLKLFYFGADTSELFAIGKAGGKATYTCGSGWPGAGDEADTSAVLCEGGPVWLVTATYMSGDTSSRTFMWVNPDPAGGAPDTNLADVKRWSKMINGFNTINIECGGGAEANINYDELRIGTDYAAVALDIGTPVGIKPLAQYSPSRFDLAQNYPNPFNPSTNISYTLKKSGMVRLAVYDLLGREVAVLVNGFQIAGSHLIPFSGTGLTSGVYFYRLENTGATITKKMILMK